MAFRLSSQAERAGYRLEGFETIGSTNLVALERARAGDPGPLWLAALSQDAGRGRGGRNWASARGNLAATLLLVMPPPLKDAAVLGFVAGLALADALEAVMPPSARLSVGADAGAIAGGGRFRLKWPNDLLADGAKLSGILLESLVLPDGRFALAIGIGVNVVTHPDDVPYPATSLRALGSDCDAETLFLALSDAWLAHYTVWNEGRGIAEIRRRWLARAAGVGGEVAVRSGGEVLRGTFETIDEECRFVIRDAHGGRRALSAGEVHFGAVATVRDNA